MKQIILSIVASIAIFLQLTFAQSPVHLRKISSISANAFDAGAAQTVKIFLLQMKVSLMLHIQLTLWVP